MYATLADLQRAYGEELLHILADRDGGGSLDTEAVDQALASASAMIDGYLGGRYTVPVSPIPPILATYAVDIAVYNLASGPGLMTDDRRERYKDAIRFLERVADGKITLGVNTPPPAAASTSLPDISSATKIFDRESMKGY